MRGIDYQGGESDDRRGIRVAIPAKGPSNVFSQDGTTREKGLNRIEDNIPKREESRGTGGRGVTDWSRKEADVVVIAEALEDQKKIKSHNAYSLQWNSKYIAVYTREDRIIET